MGGASAAQAASFNSHNTDLLCLAATTNDHPGMVYCHMDRPIGQLICSLIRLYETRAPTAVCSTSAEG